MASTDLLKELLNAGVHFGHQKGRWNPKMRKFIFGERKGIYIIDLRQTASRLQEACDYLQSLAAQGEYVLFVGTKRQAQGIISEEAQRAGMFFINNRWLGGTLTNFETICKGIKRLKEIRGMKEDGTILLLKKKEAARLGKEEEKLNRNLGGIADMDRLPAAVFVVDCKREEIAVREANKLGISVVAMLDTNADPDRVDYPIPANDDAIRSIKLVVQKVADAIEKGNQERYSVQPMAEASAPEGSDSAAVEAGAEPEPALVAAKGPEPKADTAPAENANEPTDQSPESPESEEGKQS